MLSPVSDIFAAPDVSGAARVSRNEIRDWITDELARALNVDPTSIDTAAPLSHWAPTRWLRSPSPARFRNGCDVICRQR